MSVSHLTQSLKAWEECPLEGVAKAVSESKLNEKAFWVEGQPVIGVRAEKGETGIHAKGC